MILKHQQAHPQKQGAASLTTQRKQRKNNGLQSSFVTPSSFPKEGRHFHFWLINIKHETFVLFYQQKTNTQNSKDRRDSIYFILFVSTCHWQQVGNQMEKIILIILKMIKIQNFNYFIQVNKKVSFLIFNNFLSFLKF